MLNCILGMVDKTKRALTILQQRGGSNQRESSSSNFHDQMSQHLFNTANVDPTLRKPMNEILAATIRSTEERVVEVRRRAEEAVLEVKRAAMTELQKAVNLAERQALDTVAGERLRMERLLMEASRNKNLMNNGNSGTGNDSIASSKTETDQKTQENQSICWNCGRTATETCSGCNLARYCSQFCQHKDWESHHKVCSSSSKSSVGKPKTPSMLQSPSDLTTATILAAAAASSASSSGSSAKKGLRVSNSVNKMDKKNNNQTGSKEENTDENHEVDVQNSDDSNDSRQEAAENLEPKYSLRSDKDVPRRSLKIKSLE